MAVKHRGSQILSLSYISSSKGSEGGEQKINGVEETGSRPGSQPFLAEVDIAGRGPASAAPGDVVDRELPLVSFGAARAALRCPARGTLNGRRRCRRSVGRYRDVAKPRRLCVR